jgi:hypothetical protein
MSFVSSDTIPRSNCESDPRRSSAKRSDGPETLIEFILCRFIGPVEGK